MSFRISKVENTYHKILQRVLFSIILIGIFVFPLFFLPFTKNILMIPKVFFLYGITLVGLLCWLIDMVLSKQLVICRTSLDVPILVFIGITFVSNIFSVAPIISFWGKTQNFVMSSSILLASALWFWLCVQVVDSFKKFVILSNTLIISGIVSSLLFFVTIAGWSTFLLDQANGNTVSNFNSLFGVFIGAIGLWSVTLLMQKGRSLATQIIPILGLTVSLCMLMVLSYSLSWGLFAVGIGLCIIIGITFLKEVRLSMIGVLIACFILAMSMVFVNVPESWTAQLPLEVSLGSASSFQIISDTVFYSTKNLFLGSGPGTFMQDFSLFREASFNMEQLAWAVRFHRPYSTFYAIIAENGLLGIVSFVVILLMYCGIVFLGWHNLKPSTFVKKSIEENKNLSEATVVEALGALVVGIVLSIGMFVSFYDISQWWLWWSVLALSLIALNAVTPTTVEERRYLLQVSPQYSLVLSFGVVTSFAVLILLGVFMSRMYLAEVAYTNASRVTDPKTSEALLLDAISYRGNYARYRTSLARTYLQQARVESEKSDSNPDVIADFVVKAVSEAKKATEIDENNVETWETLALMYINARPFAPEANDWAIDALDRAIALEPTNPVLYWHKGGTQIFKEDLTAAVDVYKKAIALKPDYVAAYSYLSLVYEQLNDLDKAIQVYDSAQVFSLVQNNPEILFNLGRLFYNRHAQGDDAMAEQMWLRSLELQPGYSNVLYSLGLLYERAGARDRALEFFEKVKELNPENENIKEKIDSVTYNPPPIEIIPSDIFTSSTLETQD